MSDEKRPNDGGAYDGEMIAQIRSARAQADDDERWSIRLTLGEVDALLRAVDARDDALRRLVGEWEGDIPEPRTAVEVATHTGTLGEYAEAMRPEIPHPVDYNVDEPQESAPYEHGTCRYCDGRIIRRGGPWLHVDTAAIVGGHPALPQEATVVAHYCTSCGHLHHVAVRCGATACGCTA